MIYYVHGYLSIPLSRKGKLLKEKMGVIPIKYRECEPEELVISECLKNIYDEIRNDKEVVLIGSSFGGYLSARVTKMSNNIKKLILLNPSIIPPDTDINKIKNMPIRLLKDMKADYLFKDKIKAKIYIILGSEDKVVPNYWSIKFAEIQEAEIIFLDDDHNFSKNIDNLINIINKFLNQNN